MFWDGTKEVTREQVREIYNEELTRQGAKEMWALYPENFEQRESCPIVIIITDSAFDTKRLRACYEDEDFTMYLACSVCKNIHEQDGIYTRPFTRIWKDGEWVDAN